MKKPRFFFVASFTALMLTIFVFSPAYAIALKTNAMNGLAAMKPALVSDPASLVNPFVQTDNGGNDFPGADMPFGMVQWSPDTNNRSSGGNYSYGDNQLRGYALTHIAGPGCDAMGDDPIMPMVGGAPGNVNGTMTSYSHNGETANAGYYAGITGSPSIKTELTVTQRSGMARFTYPATNQADILIKLRDSESQNGTDPSAATIVSSTEVIGDTTSGHFCGDSATYTVHFDLVFDHPFTSSQILGSGGAGPDGIFLSFDTTSNQTLQAKIGVSFVSDANAKQNWQTENPNWDFDTVHNAAHAAWNTLLTKIEIAGGTSSQQQLFYSELYHVLLHPNVVSDVTGQFMGYDHQVHTLASGQMAHYENFSGWDIEHAQAALSALVAPQQSGDMAQSLVQAYDEMGEIPQWGFMNSRNGVMIGDSADIEIAHYYAFGAHNFDTQAALTDLLHQASTSNDMRQNTSAEDQYGYIPDDPNSPSNNPSQLIEYTQDDFALSRLAQALGDTSDATRLVNRANNWKNIFDPSTDLLSPRQADGSFIHVSGDNSSFYTEGTAAQYRFQVPFNQPAEASMIGGNSATNALLDSYFQSFDGSNPNQSYLANEFDLGQPWFYNWTGEPSHTQEVVHRMLNTLYGDDPGTFPNNDDLGTMSSQYVWGMMGFYPVTPGSADVAFDSPEFTTVVVHLASGNTITVNAPQANGSNFYVQSLNVNGSPSTQTWLPASAFTTGATLDFTLGSSASSWGTGPNDAPPSYDSNSGGGGGGGGGNGTFSTGFEGGQPQPTWVSTVDTANGGLTNVGGICCGLSNPESVGRTEMSHSGNIALMYSGMDNSATSSYAYMELFDLSGQNVAVGANTTLSYWIYPQSSATSGLVSGNNSSCVALDLSFSDGTNLRDSGAVDQNGNRAHPAFQCGTLTMDSWNHVTVNLGAVANGKTIVRVSEGYDQPANTGGYRGYIDDISIS